MFELESVAGTASILTAGGWTLLTGINLMLFSLLHNPCSTTIYTIYKETRRYKVDSYFNSASDCNGIYYFLFCCSDLEVNCQVKN